MSLACRQKSAWPPEGGEQSLPLQTGLASAEVGLSEATVVGDQDRSVDRTVPAPRWMWVAMLLIPQAGLLYFFRGFTVDDTWILMRYARNLAEGHGLVYNPGEAVEGYTSFLWVILLAGGMKAGADGRVVAHVLGVGLAAATTIVGYLLGRRVTPGGGYLNLIVPAGLATSLPLAVWAVSGMDTVLFAFLVTLTLYLHLESGRRARPYLSAAGWVCGLAALARPEGWLFLAIIATHRLWRPTHHGRRADLAAYLGGFLALTIPHLLWRYHYYGYWVPNTFYVKAIISKSAGVLYTWDFLSYHGGLLLVALMALPLALRRRSEEWTVVAFALLVWVLYVGRLGGWMPLFRFFIPVLPLCFVLAQAGTVEIAHGLRRAALSQIGLRVLGALLVLALATHIVCQLHFHRRLSGTHQSFIAIGKELRQYAQPGDTLAAIDAGAMPCFSELPTTDIIGLTDAHIAHTPYRRYEFARPVFGDEHEALVRYDGAYILGKQPTFVELPTGGKVALGEPVVSSRPEVYLLVEEPEFREHYVPLFERGHLTIFVRKDKAEQRRLMQR